MTTFAEGTERNTALGVWGAVGAFGAVAGVLLGGILTDWLSWEWIFYINVPVGLAALALTPVLLTESRDAHVKSFDAVGAVLVTGGLVTLVYAITQANDYGWASAETIGLFAAAIALLAGVRRLGGPRQGAADAVLDLPDSNGECGQHRGADPRAR